MFCDNLAEGLRYSLTMVEDHALDANYRMARPKDYNMDEFFGFAKSVQGNGRLPWVFRLLTRNTTTSFAFPTIDPGLREFTDVLPWWYKQWFHEATLINRSIEALAAERSKIMYGDDYSKAAKLRDAELDVNHALFRERGVTQENWQHLMPSYVAQTLGIDALDPDALRANIVDIIANYPPTSRAKHMLSYHPKMLSMLCALYSSHIEPENPSIIHWYERDLTRVDVTDIKPKSAKLSKFLRRLNSEFDFTIPDAYIEQVATWVGDKLRLPEYDIDVRDEGFLRTYQESYFGSCMHTSDAVKFYRKQNKSYQTTVEIMTIRDPESGHLVGRALVWRDVLAPDNTSATVLDRIYPSDNGAHIRAAIAYAKKHGWVYKTQQAIDGPLSVPGEFRVAVRDVNYYPYMDTFAHTDGPDHDGGEFILSNRDNYNYSLRSTSDQCPWNLGEECGHCGERHPVDDMNYSQRDDVYVCPDCVNDGSYYYCESVRDYVRHDELAWPENCSTYPVPYDDPDLSEDVNGTTIYTGYIPQYEIEHDCLVVTHGRGEGGLVIERDAHIVYDEEAGEDMVYASRADYENRLHYEAEQDRQYQINHPTSPQSELF